MNPTEEELLYEFSKMQGGVASSEVTYQLWKEDRLRLLERVAKMTEVAARPKRTKEEWEALQAEQAKQEPPEWHGHTGTVEVKVKMRDGIEYWYAPSPVELDKMEHIKVEVRYRRRWRTRIDIEDRNYWSQAKPDSWVRKEYKTYQAYKKKNATHKVLPTGGSTDVTLFTHDGHYVRATVKCHQTDNFNKKIGYVLAVNRALTELQR